MAANGDKWKALATAIACLFVSQTEATANTSIETQFQDRIVMFVAAWCVPCHAELARLPEIRAAAKPRDIVIVPLDGGWRSREMMRGVPADEVWRPDAARIEDIAKNYFEGNNGLPLSIMFTKAGTPCARSRKSLDRDMVAAMAKYCGAD